MSKKPNKTSREPLQNPAEKALRSRLLHLSVLMVVISVLKVLAVIFFDLGAITNFTGQLNPDLAVESGMGRICFAAGLVLFMSGAYGLGARQAQQSQLKNMMLLAVIACACGAATLAIGVVDGHNPSDVITSLAGCVVAGLQAHSARQIRQIER